MVCGHETYDGEMIALRVFVGMTDGKLEGVVRGNAPGIHSYGSPDELGAVSVSVCLSVCTCGSFESAAGIVGVALVVDYCVCEPDCSVDAACGVSDTEHTHCTTEEGARLMRTTVMVKVRLWW